MGSRIMHYAIASEIVEKCNIKDKNRFFVGTLLPDVIDKNISHCRNYLDKKITYNTIEFRNNYYQNIINDDLYLGYYLHIIQDLVFREFLYNKLKFKYSNKNIKCLHNDYDILNLYLIDKYNIKPLKFDIEGFKHNKNDIKKVLLDIECDFTKIYKSNNKNELVYLNYNNVIEYINHAVDCCINEIKALKVNCGYIDPFSMCWDAPKINHFAKMFNKCIKLMKKVIKKILNLCIKKKKK